MIEDVIPAQPGNGQKLVRLAMWSGPRNISTALMRSWGNRGDTVVCDEPLYAHYLKQTGLQHHISQQIIDYYETDWRKVVKGLVGPIPGGKAIYYQKHMAHHLLPGIEREWLGKLAHGFLIRDPNAMITSLIQHIPEPTLADTGLPQQVEIFEFIKALTGIEPPVIDSRDVLENPRGILVKLCSRFGVVFDEAMLKWPAGLRDTDGIWAPYWYSSVENSTGFMQYKPKPEIVPVNLQGLLSECMHYYKKLYDCRITV